jgi:DNA-directed RNA polymerase specialized sigma24 family protein
MSEYVNNKIFKELLKRYKKTKSRNDYNEIGKIFLLISRNFLNKSYFINYSEDRKQEMISDAVFFMCKYIDRFDVNKDHPFSYFTQVAKNAFLQYINERKKQDDMFKNIEYIDHIDESEMLGRNE